MKNVKLLPYKQASESAGALAKALEIPRLRHEGSTLKGRQAIKIINWGAASTISPEFAKCSWINDPVHVAVAANKKTFFERYQDFPHLVPSTTSKDTVRDWLAEGFTVVARQVLNGHSGRGIVIMDPQDPDTWVDAELFTKYMKKKHEFRVHFCGGEIIDVQKKAVKEGTENPNYQIRNHDNGFVFIRGFGDLPEVVRTVSESFIEFTDLDFGAIDIIFNERANSAYTLEVNTAPGLTGQTVLSYKAAFEKMLGANR